MNGESGEAGTQAAVTQGPLWSAGEGKTVGAKYLQSIKESPAKVGWRW